MEADLLYKSLFFGGIYGLAFFLIYRFGRKAAPSRALWLSVGSWFFLMVVMLTVDGASSIFLSFPTFFTALLLLRRTVESREISTLQAFFTDNRIYKADTIPEQVSTLLGSVYYSCAIGTVTTESGAEINYNWWEGMTSSMISTGKANITTYTYYLAVSFAPNRINDEFKRIARAKADTSGLSFKQKFKRLFVLDTETPVRIEETVDGSFVIIWQTNHDVRHFAYYVNWLKTSLSESTKKIQTTMTAQTDPVSIPESSLRPKLESTKEQHESALGQAPKPSSLGRTFISRS